MSEAYGYEAEAPPGDGIISYLPSILWQRRWWIIVPLVICTIAGLLAAFLLPSTYRSSATLLVETPQTQVQQQAAQPGNLIDKRIAKVRQQVLSRPDLIELIENNNLYSEERQQKPLSEVIDTMRKSTSISPVSADIGGGGNQSNTIAFSLSFQYSDPQKAQIVAQDFVERLVRLDATQTAQQATGTVEFLQEQADGLTAQINAIERQVQGIKAANGMVLSNSNPMMIGGGGNYESQIAGLQRENAQLMAQLKLQSTAVDRDPSVAAAEAQLAGARAVYSDNHPDVRLAEQRLAESKRLAATNVKKFNPSSLVQQQIAANNAAIANLSSAQNADQARAGAVATAQARGPAINEQIAQLQAKADGLRSNYQTVATNLMGARGNAKLSEQQKGERLTVIDPPVVADQPSWPNRPLLILGGIAAGAAIGFALAFLLELIMRPIRGVSSLQQIIGEPPLVIVPKLGGKRAPFRLPWRRNGTGEPEFAAE